MKTIALIDMDIVLVSSTFAATKPHPFNPDKKIFDKSLAKAIVKGQVSTIMKNTQADEHRIYMSCSRDDNWRRDVSPLYKANRDKTKPPEGLEYVREYIYKTYDVITKPRLEADDLISMEFFTKENGVKKIICSKDKDLLNLGPGYTYSMTAGKVRKTNASTCAAFFVYQCMVGDGVDNIKGISRIGAVKAKKFIKSLPALSMAWDEMEALASKQGHEEGHLLEQARQVYLLRPGDYNETTGEVRLFEPSDLLKML